MKLYAKIVSLSPVETRTKKDGSGTYLIKELSLQVYDKDAQPGCHIRYNGMTGDKIKTPDVIRHSALNDAANALEAQGFTPGEVVIVEVAIEPERYRDKVTGYYKDGLNDVVRVQSIQKYQQPNAPQP